MSSVQSWAHIQKKAIVHRKTQRAQRENRFSFLLRGQKGKNLMPSGHSNDRIVMDLNKLSSKIISAVIEVHKALGTGLLKSK